MPIMVKGLERRTVRLPADVDERLLDFAAESELSVSGAMRVLIERGLDSDIDVDQLSAVQFNATAAALEKLDELVSDLVEKLREVD